MDTLSVSAARVISCSTTEYCDKYNNLRLVQLSGYQNRRTAAVCTLYKCTMLVEHHCEPLLSTHTVAHVGHPCAVAIRGIIHTNY